MIRIFKSIGRSEFKKNISMIAKAVHLFDDIKLSLSVFACCCVTVKSSLLAPSSKSSSVLPRTSYRLDLFNLGALSVGVTNCQ